MQRKGTILAGGSGTRHYPITVSVSKLLLPILHKPMIHQSISLPMLSCIGEIALINKFDYRDQFQRLLVDGSRCGLSYTWIVQNSPDGLAQAYTLADYFLDGAPTVMMLGDNFFFGHGLPNVLCGADQRAMGETVFDYQLSDPERYGLVALNKGGLASEIIGKRAAPPSSYTVTVLYFRAVDAPRWTRSVQPSERGELEISFLLQRYLDEMQMSFQRMSCSDAWLDTGTHASLWNPATSCGPGRSVRAYKPAAITRPCFWTDQHRKENLPHGGPTV